MEHEVFKIPRPDLIIYLDLPLTVSQALLQEKQRNRVLAEKKRYTTRTRDAAEENMEHLDQARRNALKLVAAKNNWVKIDCAPRRRSHPGDLQFRGARTHQRHLSRGLGVPVLPCRQQ
jgi:dTMP kinase